MIRLSTHHARSFLALCFAAGLAGCNSNASPVASAPPPAAPFAYAGQSAASAGPPLPPGAPCTAEIGKWRKLVSGDVQNGMLDESVYKQIEVEISKARTTCAAGQNAKALRMIQASRKRHGYPPG